MTDHETTTCYDELKLIKLFLSLHKLCTSYGKDKICYGKEHFIVSDGIYIPKHKLMSQFDSEVFVNSLIHSEIHIPGN